MEKQPDSEFFTTLMSSADMGWWEADLQRETYRCSEYIADLLGIGADGVIRFEDFDRLVLWEEPFRTTVHTFRAQKVSEAVHLLRTTRGDMWVRNKICFRKTDAQGHMKVYGITEVQDGPDMSAAYQALRYNRRVMSNIYKNLPVGIELYDKEGILIDLNDKELEIFHMDRKEDLLGIDIFKNPVFPKEMKERLRRHEDADFTFRYDFSKIGDYYPARKREGTIDLVTKVTTLYDEHRNPTNYLLINADKTEATVAYNRIQEFESLFELVGVYSKVGYAYYNLLSEQGHASRSWYTNLGEPYDRPLSEIIGVYGHVHPEDRPSVVAFVRNARNGATDKFRRELRILRDDGSQTWTYVTLLIRRYLPQEGIIEVIAVNYDITESKRIERNLFEAKTKAEEAVRLKSAFLASMSHEIRTPLNAIVGFSGLLTSADDPGEREQFVSLINHNNELLLKLVGDVLEFSKLEAGDIDLHFIWFDPAEVIAECVMENRDRVPAGVELRIVPTDGNFVVESDPSRVRQILNNLISNALKNTTEGYVEVACETTDSGVELRVTDTGCGIPQDMFDRIFERFEKVDSFMQGVGLGLAICKSLAEKMGGEIVVESEFGRGSTFHVKLPCPRRAIGA